MIGAPARAMLRATGFTDGDFRKPQIGVAATWSMVTPCNMHLDRLGEEAVAGVDGAGGKGVPFHTITVSDGISMGTSGMRYSLVSRDVIADSIETTSEAAGFDGLVAIGGCDKNMPGCLIALGRMDRPSIFVYGGTIKPGAERRDIVSVFEAVGARAAGTIDDKELHDIECTAIPGPGSCGGMYTANTMASAIEALGMSLPGSSAQEADGLDKAEDCRRAGAALPKLIEMGLTPSRIMTRKAFENAIAVIIALGGSTNAVLHLPAMAHAVGVDISIDDFARIGERVPVLADLKPSGRYLMSELIAIGGIRRSMKRMLEAGMLHGDCLTVTGRTMAEDLADVEPYPEDQDLIRALDQPIKATGHLAILRGNLAPEGSVAKISGKQGTRFEGSARVFEGEEAAMAAILGGAVQAGDVIVIRNEGPVGGPGMRKCWGRPAPSWAEGSAPTSRWSPTAVFPAAVTASSSATSAPRPQSVGPSPTYAMGTASSSMPMRAPSTCRFPRPTWPSARPVGRPLHCRSRASSPNTPARSAVPARVPSPTTSDGPCPRPSSFRRPNR